MANKQKIYIFMVYLLINTFFADTKYCENNPYCTATPVSGFILKVCPDVPSLFCLYWLRGGFSVGFAALTAPAGWFSVASSDKPYLWFFFYTLRQPVKCRILKNLRNSSARIDKVSIRGSVSSSGCKLAAQRWYVTNVTFYIILWMNNTNWQQL